MRIKDYPAINYCMLSKKNYFAGRGYKNGILKFRFRHQTEMSNLDLAHKHAESLHAISNLKERNHGQIQKNLELMQELSRKRNELLEMRKSCFIACQNFSSLKQVLGSSLDSLRLLSESLHPFSHIPLETFFETEAVRMPTPEKSPKKSYPTRKLNKCLKEPSLKR